MSSECDAALSKLPPEVKSKVDGWRNSGGAANLEMAAHYLDLMKGLSPEVGAAATKVAQCLRAEAAVSKGAGAPVAIPGIGIPGVGGVPTDAECITILTQLKTLYAGKAPGLGEILANGDATQLEALAKFLENPVPPISDPTMAALFKKAAVCVRIMVAQKKAAAPGVAVVKGCLKNPTTGEDMPDMGLAAVSGAFASTIGTTVSTATITKDAPALRTLAKQLRENCQGKAADELNLLANSIDGLGTGDIGTGDVPGGFKWPTGTDIKLPEGWSTEDKKLDTSGDY
jgi:hypothetical protein